MTHLHQIISERVAEWRKAGYPAERYPVVSEILDYQIIRSLDAPRFLRWPQLWALETYWYLRVAEETPNIFDLYRKYFPHTTALLDALGLGSRELERFLIDHATCSVKKSSTPPPSRRGYTIVCPAAPWLRPSPTTGESCPS